jgi:hypothetical protein
MDANVAILDRDGRIVHVNKNWRSFAAEHGGNLDIGANYFDACPATAGAEGAGATLCLEGLRKVLRGELAQFSHDYPCDSLMEKRWYRLHAVPLGPPEPGLAVAHFNITSLKQAELLLGHNGSAAAGRSVGSLVSAS